KTIEGVIGGTVVNGVLLLIIAGVYGAFINKQVDMHYGMIFLMGMLCSPVGLLGDLSASVIKRQAQIKDYGNIMPGHGGVMDRFDSVILVAPFMYWLFSIGALITVK
ncbi:MAG: phosphatidate cytidylyltransferase, partial [Ruminococcus sp.]|nr:phosphatidate cytidylyltransferase [Ruminococcus sp.]